jgi:hypothetical protein
MSMYSRRFILAKCFDGEKLRICTIIVRKLEGEIELDLLVEGASVIILEREAGMQVRDALTEMLAGE